MPAINLQKHGAEMQKALKSVRDPKNSTDWALFGYDGKTFDLKVVETGEDGIEDMVNDLNPSKIRIAPGVFFYFPWFINIQITEFNQYYILC